MSTLSPDDIAELQRQISANYYAARWQYRVCVALVILTFPISMLWSIWAGAVVFAIGMHGGRQAARAMERYWLQNQQLEAYRARPQREKW